MARLQTIHTFDGGMDKDTPFSRRKPNTYFHSKNVKVFANGANKTLTKHEGIIESIDFPKITERFIRGRFDNTAYSNYTDPITGINYENEVYAHPNLGRSAEHDNFSVVGTTEINNSIIFIAVDDLNYTAIFAFKEGEYLRLLYSNYLGMNNNTRIEIVPNFENTNVQKLYWVDGINQLRHVNINDPDLKLLAPYTLDLVNPVKFSEPVLDSLTNTTGSFSSGRVQYAYSLYNLSGQESVISSASAFIDVINPDTGQGGGKNGTTLYAELSSEEGHEDVTIPGVPENAFEELNVAISASIKNIDPGFSNIKIYRLLYKSIDKEPLIELIIDQRIDSYSNFIINDVGLPPIGNPVTMFELLNKGAKKIVPNTIESKKNSLFIANYESKTITLDFDSRAYKYPYKGSETIIYESTSKLEPITIVSPQTLVPYNHMCYSKDARYMYAANKSMLGATGKFLELTFREVSYIKASRHIPTFKRGETYRFGVEFFDEFGLKSDVKWICDFSFPYTRKLDHILEAELKMNPSGIAKLKENNITGYRLMVVERTYKDKTIISQGIINPLMAHKYSANTTPQSMPYPSIKDYTGDKGARVQVDFDDGVDFDSVDDYASTVMKEELAAFNSPDITFREPITNVHSVRPLGFATLENTESNSQNYKAEFSKVVEKNVIDGIGFSVEGRKYMYRGENEELSEESNYIGFSKKYVDTTIEFLSGKIKGDNDKLVSNNVSVVDFGKVKSLNGNKISSEIDIRNFVGKDFQKKGLMTQFSDFLAIDFGTTSWHYGSTNVYKYGAFNEQVPKVGIRRLMIAELINNNPVQYGGLSYYNRQRNVYIPSSNFTSLESNSAIGEGDIWITNFRFLRNTAFHMMLKEDRYFHDEYIDIMLESNLNLDTRYDYSNGGELNDFQYFYKHKSYKVRGNDEMTPMGPYIMDMNRAHLYNNVYNQANNKFPNYAKPDNVREVSSFPSTILASDTKFNNETIDSWLSFKPANTMTLDSSFGPITYLHGSNDNVIAFQPRAIAYLAISPRVQAISTDGMSIGLGTGTILQDYSYITTSSGCLHKWSVINDKKSVFYFDYYNRTFNVMNDPEVELTSIKGLNDLFWTYIDEHKGLGDDVNSVHHGVVSGYSNRNENIYVTLSQPEESFTISYSTIYQNFVSFHDFTPNFYVPHRGDMYIIDKDDIYKFDINKFTLPYTNSYPFSITILNTDKSMFNKRYDNLEIDSNVDFDTIECTNSYQTSGVIPFNAKTSVNRRRALIPRQENSRHRLRDNHMYMTLISDSDLDMNLEFATISYNMAKVTYDDTSGQGR